MPVAPKSLILIVYAPALRGTDERPLAIVHGLERTLPGLHLEWRLSEQGEPIALPQRDMWLAAETRDGGFPLVCNGDENSPVTIAGLQTPAGIASGGQPLFDVHAELPLDEAVIAAGVEMLEAVAEGARALWGHATPNGVAAEISQQTRHSMHQPHVPPRGLPAIKLPEEIRSPDIPHHLGWLNYWSAAAALAIGFPAPARDADLLSRARRTGTGGWIVRLTEEPLDLDNPAHLSALLRAYERFPAIGGRSTP